MYDAHEFHGRGRAGHGPLGGFGPGPRGHGHRDHGRRGHGGGPHGPRRHEGFGRPGFGLGDAPGFGPGHGRGGGRGRGRGRARRGEIRTAVLLLLAEEPMHGYQLMRAIGERTDGAWEPSPGAIYPTLAQLEDEGLVTVTVDGGRKLAALTDTGRTEAAALADQDPFAEMAPRRGHRDLRAAAVETTEAARTVARSGSEAQVQAATQILAEARRRLYLLLAEGEAPPSGAGADAED